MKTRKTHTPEFKAKALTPAILIGGLAGAAWQSEGRVFWQSLAAVAIALPAGWLLWRAAGQGARHAGLVALAMLALASALGSFPVLARIGHVWPSVALAAQARAAPGLGCPLKGPEDARPVFWCDTRPRVRAKRCTHAPGPARAPSVTRPPGAV